MQQKESKEVNAPAIPSHIFRPDHDQLQADWDKITAATTAAIQFFVKKYGIKGIISLALKEDYSLFTLFDMHDIIIRNPDAQSKNP